MKSKPPRFALPQPYRAAPSKGGETIKNQNQQLSNLSPPLEGDAVAKRRQGESEARGLAFRHTTKNRLPFGWRFLVLQLQAKQVKQQPDAQDYNLNDCQNTKSYSWSSKSNTSQYKIVFCRCITSISIPSKHHCCTTCRHCENPR
jgi:hypothetical protein